MEETIGVIIMGSIMCIALYFFGIAASTHIAMFISDQFKCDTMKKPIKIVGLIPIVHHCFTVLSIIILLCYAIAYALIYTKRILWKIPGIIKEYVNE